MKISIQTGDIVDRVGLEEGYALIKETGFDAVDWNIDHAWKGSEIRKGNLGNCVFDMPLEGVIDYYAKELEIINKNGLELTQAHAPFPSFSKDHPEVLDYAIGVYKRNIEFCQYAKIRNLVIHGISYSLNDDINTKETIDKLNFKLYSSLIPVLKDTDVTVCLENLFSSNNGVCYQGHCSDPYAGAKEIDELNALAGKECFGLCLDTGHANLLHHDLRTFIAVYGKRIKALHIHDNNGSGDEHEAPLTGTINWNHFCSALKEVGYEGDLSFETFAQTNEVMNFDMAMLKPWMILINETGKVFRSKIQG